MKKPDCNDSISYEIFVLRQMINQLPDNLSCVLAKQIDAVEKSIVKQIRDVYKTILPHLEDAMVDIKYMEFDRHATELEKQKAMQLKLTSQEILVLEWLVGKIKDKPAGAITTIKQLLARQNINYKT